MATVTKLFRDNYEFWIAHKLATGQFDEDEANELKEMIRKDLTEGPDQLRDGLTVILAAGVEMPANIDDHQERYRLWDEFFTVECEEILEQQRNPATGINQRIRDSIQQSKTGQQARAA